MLRYLRGIIENGILFGRVARASPKVFGFVDLDFVVEIYN